MFLNEENEKWILDYLGSGKGMIPYQLITDFESLNIRPGKEIFFTWRLLFLPKRKKH